MSSPHNGSGYYGLKEEINDALSREHFRATLSGAGDTSVQYARTGYLGFMMKSDKTDRTGGKGVGGYMQKKLHTSSVGKRNYSSARQFNTRWM